MIVKVCLRELIEKEIILVKKVGTKEYFYVTDLEKLYAFFDERGVDIRFREPKKKRKSQEKEIKEVAKETQEQKEQYQKKYPFIAGIDFFYS